MKFTTLYLYGDTTQIGFMDMLRLGGVRHNMNVLQMATNVVIGNGIRRFGP